MFTSVGREGWEKEEKSRRDGGQLLVSILLPPALKPKTNVSKEAEAHL